MPALYLYCVALCVLIFVATSTAEDLTTLDGRRFNAITDISAYKDRVFFTFRGQRTNVYLTNITDDFLAAHRLNRKTNAPPDTAHPAKQPLDPLDAFLWANRTLDLSRRASLFDFTNSTSRHWTLTVTPGVLTLELSASSSFGGRAKDFENNHLMTFDLEKAPDVEAIFNKFLAWESTAASNRVENFTKEIARRPLNRYRSGLEFSLQRELVYIFEWRDAAARLNIQQPDPWVGSFDKEDIIRFKALLRELPRLKHDLADGIRRKGEHENLFK